VRRQDLLDDGAGPTVLLKSKFEKTEHAKGKRCDNTIILAVVSGRFQNGDLKNRQH
jgi:hypothetical protein